MRLDLVSIKAYALMPVKHYLFWRLPCQSVAMLGHLSEPVKAPRQLGFALLLGCQYSEPVTLV